MSGGKDSALLALCLSELQKHSRTNFELVFLTMDPGYHPLNRKKAEENAALLDIPLEIFESEIYDTVYGIEKNPCYLCARMRRGYLYSNAKQRGCNKIALGHHFNDVIETVMMGMLYSGQFQTMMPKLKSQNFEGMTLIRPLYMVREQDIIRWRDANNLEFLNCACRFTEDRCVRPESDEGGGTRMEMKRLIRELKKKHPSADINILRATTEVNLKTIISYKDDDGIHSVMDDLD